MTVTHRACGSPTACTPAQPSRVPSETGVSASARRVPQRVNAWRIPSHALTPCVPLLVSCSC